MSLTEQLRERRSQARTAADEIVTRAAGEERDLTPDELTAYNDHVGAEREAADRLEAERDVEVRELRAGLTRVAATPEPYPLGSWLVRAINESGGVGQAFTPGEFPSTFFDVLVAQSVALRSGIRVVETTRDSITFPRWVSDTSAAWVAEGGTITSTDADADTVTAIPRKVAGLQRVSNETLADSSPSVYEVIAAGLVRSVALKIDLGVYEGSGTAPEIRGLLHTAGVQTIPAVGTPVNLDDFADALGLLSEANANSDAAVIVMAPALWAELAILKETATSNKPLLMNSSGSGAQGIQRQLYGAPVFLSSQIDPANAYVYDPAQVVMVRRADVSVVTDSSRLFNSDESEIRAIARVDLVVPNPAAVVVLQGVYTVS